MNNEDVIASWIQARVARLMGEQNQRSHLERVAKDKMEDQALGDIDKQIEEASTQEEKEKLRSKRRKRLEADAGAVRRNAAYLGAHLAMQELHGMNRAISEIIKANESRIHSPPTGIITPDN